MLIILQINKNAWKSQNNSYTRILRSCITVVVHSSYSKVTSFQLLGAKELDNFSLEFKGINIVLTLYMYSAIVELECTEFILFMRSSFE